MSAKGDILVFLTGQDEIESLEKLINDAADTYSHISNIRLSLILSN